MQENGNSDNAAETRDMLYLVGGAAFLVLGAGLILTHPSVRKTVSTGLGAVLPELQGKFAPDLATIGPDIQRYLKLRSM